jgi:hypothetical protein
VLRVKWQGEIYTRWTTLVLTGAADPGRGAFGWGLVSLDLRHFWVEFLGAFCLIIDADSSCWLS